MYSRRIACFLLGGWLIGSVLMLFVNYQNYEAAGSLVRSPPPQAAKLLSTLPGGQGHMLLFFMANEASRSYEPLWGGMQLAMGIGTAMALFLERRTRLYSAGIALVLLLVLFELFIILPQLDWLGRSIDFIPANLSSTTRNQYWNLRAVYLGIDAMKMLVAAGIAAALIMMRTRTRTTRRDSNDGEVSEIQPARAQRPQNKTGSGQHAART